MRRRLASDSANLSSAGLSRKPETASNLRIRGSSCESRTARAAPASKPSPAPGTSTRKAQTFGLYRVGCPLPDPHGATVPAPLSAARRDRAERRHWPVATLALAAMMLLVRLVLQANDAEIARSMQDAYAASDLATIELPRYRAWLARRADDDAQGMARLAEFDREARTMQAAQLEQDPEFLADLRGNRIVLRSDRDFTAWRSARDLHDAQLDRIVMARYDFARSRLEQAWRLASFPFVHRDALGCLGNVVVLLLAGPLVEAALGRWRMLLVFVSGALAGAAAFALASAQSLAGAGSAVAAVAATAAAAYGMRRIDPLRMLGARQASRPVPAVLLIVVAVALNEVIRQADRGLMPWSMLADAAGLVAGLALASAFGAAQIRRRIDAGPQVQGRIAALRMQAQEAVGRRDVKRAAQLYGELVRRDPSTAAHLTGYLNVALLGRDADVLRDAALRMLAVRIKPAAPDLRKAYLQLSQPTVLATLDVDDQLRLARRLVRAREDAAALRLIDSLVERDDIREAHGRPLADCLLGLFTTYRRDGRVQQAEAVKSRLARHFHSSVPPPEAIPEEPLSNTVWAPAPHGADEAYEGPPTVGPPTLRRPSGFET